jgi:hypothetical protein
LQYHRLIWFHNKKYTRSSTASTGSAPAGGSRPTVTEDVLGSGTEHRAKYGAAELISRRLLYYIAFGILFGLLYQGPRQFLGYMSLKNSQGLVSEQSLVTHLAISFLWGYAFIHYYLDSKIWRVRRDPSVGKALNMT